MKKSNKFKNNSIINKKYGNKSGITLIALMITVIVLLILAGVTLSLTLGERGIFRTAKGASRNYLNSQEEEKIELNNFDKEVNNEINGENNITPPQKEENLESKAKPGDYVAYIPPQNNPFTMEIDDTGYSLPQNYNTGDYKGLWQVLYNDTEHGLQIISADDVTNGTKLYLGTTASSSKGESTETGKIAYNKSVTTLNKFCEKYTNEVYAIVGKGRCVGSNPDNLIDTTEKYTNSSYSYIATYAKDLLAPEENYQKDYNAMKGATSQNENGINVIEKEYWLASRAVNVNSSNVSFCQRFVPASGASGWCSSLLVVDSNGIANSRSCGFGVRVIVTLKSSINTNDGNGSIEQPFKLVPNSRV